jgi:hypothetical protein
MLSRMHSHAGAWERGNDLPVYRDTYQLILKIFEVTKDFPGNAEHQP